MKRLLPAILSALLLLTGASTAFAAQKTYAVIFEVNVDANGAISSLKAVDVVDGTGESVNLRVPPAFLKAARQALAEKRYDGRDRTFFTYLLFDPQRPDNARIGMNDPPASDEAATQPSHSLSLSPNQSVTIRLNEQGWEIVQRNTVPDGPATQLEEATAKAFAGGFPNGSTGPIETRKDLPERPLSPRNAIRLTMKRITGEAGTMLIVENGYNQLLGYQASMRVGQRGPKPTSVCQVSPGVPSMEHWPYPIRQLDLSEFRLLPGDSRQIVCR